MDANLRLHSTNAPKHPANSEPKNPPMQQFTGRNFVFKPVPNLSELLFNVVVSILYPPNFDNGSILNDTKRLICSRLLVALFIAREQVYTDQHQPRRGRGSL